MKLVIRKIDQDARDIEDEIFEQFPLARTLGKQFFSNLIYKLKKLSKTKEEIIKYCMRKAFKFVNERLKEEGVQLPDSDILKEFLKGINDEDPENIPFKYDYFYIRKNSNFKTMNTHFLSELFKSPKFAELYHEFLKAFPKICQSDNERKIQNLTKVMFNHINTNSKDLKRFNNFKRIPWTNAIISKCQQIAKDLQKYSSENGKRLPSFTDK